MCEFDLTSMHINEEFVSKIVAHKEYNKLMAEYYYKLSLDTEYYRSYNKETKTYDKKEFWSILNKVDRLKACNDFWVLNKYEQSRIKDFLKTYLCKDPFCANCKKVRQAQRMNNYLDLFQKHDEHLYFITITIPNCIGNNLRSEIQKLFDIYSTLIKCLQGKNKVFSNLGLDIVFGGFRGAVRSLEVTYKKDGRNRFHPHLHVAVVLDDYVMTKKYRKNRFSYGSDKTIKRLFNLEELKLQKLMYLFYNNCDKKKITHKYLENLRSEQNFSLTIDKFKPGQYAEMFKYMIKDNFSDVVSGQQFIMDYDTFKFFYKELWHIRQIQGCGIFSKITDDNDFTLENDVNEIYDIFIYSLKQIELPVVVEEAPENVLDNIHNGRYLYISRKKIFSYLRKSLLSEKFSLDDFKSKDSNSLINYTLINDLLNDIIAYDETRSKEIRVNLEKENEFLANPKYTVI